MTVVSEIRHAYDWNKWSKYTMWFKSYVRFHYLTTDGRTRIVIIGQTQRSCNKETAVSLGQIPLYTDTPYDNIRKKT